MGNAAFTFNGTNKSVYFSGRNIRTFPPSQETLGLPGEGLSSFAPAGIDAALPAANGKLYLFAGRNYVRLSPGSGLLGQIDSGYPKPISLWDFSKHFEFGIDAALSSGTKYFIFSGDQFVRCSSVTGKVDSGYPQPISRWGWAQSRDAKASGAFGAFGIDAAMRSGPRCYFYSGDRLIAVERGDTGYGTIVDRSTHLSAFITSTEGRWSIWRAAVSKYHGPDVSAAAIDIKTQVKTAKLSSEGATFSLPPPEHHGRLKHNQDIALLRPAGGSYSTGPGTIGIAPYYDRIAVSYNYGIDGLAIAQRPRSDRAFAEEHMTTIADVPFDGPQSRHEVKRNKQVGPHAHPGGMQAHGDVLAIAMEEPETPATSAAVYFVRVSGTEGETVNVLTLGTGGAPTSLDSRGAASAGFIRLRDGRYLVAVSGRKNGLAGIWFYVSGTYALRKDMAWTYVDFWTPDRMPSGEGNIDRLESRLEDGKISLDYFIGGGGATSLLTDKSGAIFLMLTTGTWGFLENNDDFAQLFEVSVLHGEGPRKVHLAPVWVGKEKHGLSSPSFGSEPSFRFAAARQTTNSGKLLFLSAERLSRPTVDPLSSATTPDQPQHVTAGLEPCTSSAEYPKPRGLHGAFGRLPHEFC